MISDAHITKSQFIEHLTTKTGLPKKQVEKIVNNVFQAIMEAMTTGGRVEIRGFASFFVKDYKSYQGRNPKTGEPVKVAEKRLPFFKVGKELRRYLNEHPS
jgi:integration host factor subunit beta